MENNKIKILAIDDNQDNLVTLKALINEFIFNVSIFTATSGKNGLELAAKEFPDVILLDIVMPEMDGYEVCEILKADEKLKNIPVVFVTALKGDKESRIRALECGGDAFIAKPIDESELVAQIRAMVKIKEANIEKLDKEKHLQLLVEEKTRDLVEAQIATLNLLEDLKEEIELRKLAEAAIRQKEEDYRKLFENHSAVKLIIDPDSGNIYDANYAASQYYGWSRDELKKMKIQQINATESSTQILERLKKSVALKKIQFELKHKKADGQIRDVEIYANTTIMSGKELIHAILFDITERKQAEIQLHESEERFYSLFQKAPLGYQSLNVDGYFIEVNEQWLNTLGYNYDEVIGKWFGDFLAPNYKDAFRERFPIFMARGVIISEFEMVHKNGSTRFVSFNGKIAHDENGNFKQTHCILRDITEQRKAEEALLESEKNLKNGELVANFGNWKLDLKKRLIIASQGARKIYGFDKKIITINDIQKVRLPEYDSIMNELDKKLIKEKKSYEAEFKIKRLSDGKIVDIFAKTIYDVNSDSIFGTIQDITERKIAEFEREQFFKFWNISDDIMVIADPNGCFKKINPACLSVLGYDEKDMLSKPFIDFVYPDDRQNTLNEMARQIKKGSSINFVNRYLCKDGTIKWLSWTANYFHKENTTYAAARDISEQKKIEEALSESEEKYRMVINTMNEGLVTVNNDDVIQFVNERMLQMIGYTLEEVIGKKANELFIVEEYHDLIKEKNRLRMEKKSDIYELQFRKKNGEIIWVLISGSPIIDLDGNVIGSIGVHSEITERKIHEQKLQQLSQAVEQSPASVVITDLDGNIQYVNSTYTYITGYSFDETMGKNPRILKSGEKPKEEYKEMWDTIKSGKQWRGEFHNKKKNGELYWESALISPIINLQKVTTNYLAIKSDITQSKLQAEELKNSEQKFRSVAQSANDAIISSNSKGEIIGWNLGAQKIFGFKEEYAIGQKMDLIIPQNYLNEHLDGIKNDSKINISKLIGKTVEVEGKNKNGNIFPIELSLAKWETNEGTYFTAIIRDITDRKHTELLQEKITKDLIQRNKDLEQFTYIVSHNLRAPVANIKGFNDLLYSLALNENQKDELLRDISTSINKLDDVIQDLNTILQVKQNFSEKKESVNFLDLVNDVKLSIGLKIGNADIIIKTDFNQVNEMVALKSYMFSVFHNLISNSIKYRQHNTSCVIEIISELEKNKLSLIFKDNGLGIDLDKKGKLVFGLYKRFHANIDGKGVGLYMVRTQIESLGGTINIKSKVNKGTEFLIEFNL